jgi:hypothetical protein
MAIVQWSLGSLSVWLAGPEPLPGDPWIKKPEATERVELGMQGDPHVCSEGQPAIDVCLGVKRLDVVEETSDEQTRRFPTRIVFVLLQRSRCRPSGPWLLRVVD